MSTPLHINTPLIESAKLSTSSQTVWLKMESMQPAGSFKNRGIGVACQHYAADGARRFISSSGGNAGIATAYAGHKLNIPVHVVVPENAPQTAINAMGEFGAEVQVHGSTWLEAHALALSMIDDDSILIHPFDDPILWPGHGTLIDEVIAAGCIPDAVVLSVGGGGLLSGIAQGLEQNGFIDTGIVAIETEGAASLAAAMKAGELVTLEKIETIANTLGAKQVCQRAFDVTRSHQVTSHIVSDRQALSACRRFLDDHRTLVEPACGAALAAVYDQADALADKNNVLVVVCGGMGVSDIQLQQWQRMLDQTS